MGRPDAGRGFWRDVPGYAGRYQASDEGQVRRVNPDGTTTLLKPFIHRYSDRPNRIQKPYKVRLMAPDGRKTERSVLAVVAESWFEIPPGMVPYHLNGVNKENGIWNIGLCTRADLGHKFGPGGNERACCKVRHGKVLEYYRSARAAAEANFICYDSVRRRCNGEVKEPYLPDGTTFRWDEPPRRK